jgi:hypothetical protein
MNFPMIVFAIGGLLLLSTINKKLAAGIILAAGILYILIFAGA